MNIDISNQKLLSRIKRDKNCNVQLVGVNDYSYTVRIINVKSFPNESFTFIINKKDKKNVWIVKRILEELQNV